MRNPFNAAGKVFHRGPGDGRTPLLEAILKGDLQKVEKLIAKGVDLNFRGALDKPPLHLALQHKQYPIALALLNAGADINLQDNAGRTPLHIVVAQNQEMFIHALLKMKADPNIKDHNGQTPVFQVSANNSQLIEVLKSYGADLNTRDMHGNVPLHYAVGMSIMVHRFITQGADINLRNNKNISPFHLMMEDRYFSYYSAAVQKMVAEHGDLGVRSAEGEWFIHIAARLGATGALDVVIDKAQLSAKNAEGETVLHVLLKRLDVDLMERVLRRLPGLAVTVDKSGQLPLAQHLARDDETPAEKMSDWIAAARLLVKSGADVNTADADGLTLLHHAVRHKWTGFMEDLIALGANVDIKDAGGKAPLHYAIENKDLHAVDALLDAHADPDLTDSRGWTVLDHLAEAGDRDSPIVQRLIVADGQYNKQLPLHPELMHPKPIEKDVLGGKINLSPLKKKIGGEEKPVNDNAPAEKEKPATQKRDAGKPVRKPRRNNGGPAAG